MHSWNQLRTAIAAALGGYRYSLTPSGSGYFGTTYTHNSLQPGNWYADDVLIPGETGGTYTLTADKEGKQIHWQDTTGGRSNYSTKLFTPDQLANVNLWLDSADATTITQSGGLLSAWGNKAAGGITCTQATGGSQPSYSTTARNSKPGVTGAASKFMNLSAGLTVDGEPSNLFVAAYGGPMSGTHRGFAAWGIGGPDGRNVAMMMFHNSGIGRLRLGSGTYDLASNGIWNDADHIGMQAMSSLGAELWLDGVSQASNTLNYSINAGSNYLLQTSVLSHAFLGVMNEVVHVKELLSTALRQKVEGYLAHKWGWTSLLAVGHPYKSTPPLAEADGIVTRGGGGYVGSTFVFKGKGTSFQWKADGVDIGGETTRQYVQTTTNEFKAISVVVDGVTYTKPALFSPGQISGMVAWLDASRTDLLTNVSGALSAMTTRSPGTVSLSQPTAGNRPTIGSRNGKQAIVHDGATKFMPFTNTGNLPTGTTPSTFFAQAAFDFTGTSGVWRALISYGGTTARTRRDMVKDDLDNVAFGGNTTDIKSGIPWLARDRIYASVFTSSLVSLFVDGAAAGTASASFNTNLVDSNVGQNSASGWIGSWREIIMYNVALGTSDRNKVEGYIAHKNNTVHMLNAAHPYKSTPPLAA